MTDEAKAKPDDEKEKANEAKEKSEHHNLKVIIDRIEDDIATVVMSDDDKVHFNLPAEYLPEGAKGGDHFQIVFKKDKESRDAEKKKADDLLKELLGQSGDKKN
jgi:hypothetical protein